MTRNTSRIIMACIHFTMVDVRRILSSFIYLLGVSIIITWIFIVSTGFANIQITLKFPNHRQSRTQSLDSDSKGDGRGVELLPYKKDIKFLCNVSIHDGMNLMKMKIPPYIKRFKNPCWYEKYRLRCLPYMYLVGVAKCGTTDLFKRITLHPDFVKPTKKETNWLTYGRFWRQETFAFYTSEFFSPLSEALKTSRSTTLITGEASINTLEGSHFWNYLGINVGHDEPLENNAQYIHHLYRETKILINVRNPVDRLWSEYLAFSRSNVKSAIKFHEIVQREIQLYNECQLTRTLRACMYDNTLEVFASMWKEELPASHNDCPIKPVDIVKLRRGVYYVFIKDFLRVFPREQILIQRLEDISSDRKGSLLRTFKFLGLGKLPKVHLQKILEFSVRNPRKTFDREKGKLPKVHLQKILEFSVRNPRKTFDREKGDMLNCTRKMLYEFYKPHNEALALLLNNTQFNYGPMGG